jgi:hypothetical protein
LVPGCRKSAVVGFSVPLGAFSTENMLPTGALMSMLLEPSRGSKFSRYLASIVLGRNLIGLLQLLRHHAGEIAAVLAGAQENVVGHHVQIHLGFALHIHLAGGAMRAGQGAAADDEADALTGEAHMIEQRGEVADGAPENAAALRS